MKLKELLVRRGVRQIQLVRIIEKQDKKTTITAPRLSSLMVGRLRFSDAERDQVRKALLDIGITERSVNAINELKCENNGKNLG